MTYEEATKTIEMAKAEVEWNYPLDYQTAFDKAVEALEKQIPKKPIQSNRPNACPCCGSEWGIHIDEYGDRPQYCTECGQYIDWSEVGQ